MKNTRKSAAIWLAMTLAISTAFGNTVWGEIRPDTEKENDENKNLNDVPAQNGAVLSVSTPSNAEDITTTGGTVTPVPQTKILSWSWSDPEENLLDGRLELTGITEDAQPSFTEVTEYLPQAIIAQVGDGEDWEEENLQITNWTCAEYVQDEEGRWPLEGTYEFKAELEEGYELAEGVDALVVEVSVAGDQEVMLAEEPPRILSVYKVNGGGQESLKWDGTSYSGQLASDSELWNKSVRVEHNVDDNFILYLKNADLGNIYIEKGNWTIVLNGNNQLDGKGKYAGGIGFYVNEGVNATITAEDNSASLTVSGYPAKNGSCGIQVQGNLTVESGTVNASLSSLPGHSYNAATGAIFVTEGGYLNIKGGSVTATGDSRWALEAFGTINMQGGTFDIAGKDKVAVDLFTDSNFTLSGGTVTITSPGHIGISTKGNLTINGGQMNANSLVIAEGVTTTVQKGGTLQTDELVIEKNGNLTNNGTLIANGGLEIGKNGNLTNNGTLIANGDFKGEGTIDGNGTISGTGSVPDSAKQTPETITGYSTELQTVYSENTLINVPQDARITKPDRAGALHYELAEYTGSESKGEGTIDGSTGQLKVNKAGVFKIKVMTQASGIYLEGTPVYITLTVDKAEFPAGWNLTVKAASGVYNGAKGYQAATITTTGIPEDVECEYQYQLAQTSDSSNLPNDWKSECPTIVNVNESGQYVFVKVITDNYESKVFRSNNKTNITRRSFKDSVKVTIEPSTYNGESQNPEIKVFENLDGVSGNELKKDDYKIDHWTYWTGTENKNVGESELKNAGSYTVYLYGMGNYDDSQKTAVFTINKCQLEAQITGSFDKVYDGTTDITEEQNLAIKLCDGNSNTPALEDVHTDQVQWAYQSADVGECDIVATNILLAGDQAENYELTEPKVSQKGRIKPRDFASMTVSADPLTYNGTGQQPKINASVETGLENVRPDAVFTYSTDGVDYQKEIPGFTDAGTYLVYVKASMANFNDKVQTVTVTVKPKESSSGGNSGNNTSGGSGTANQTVNDGYSLWMKDANGWWLRFADGTWFQPLIAVSPIICVWNICC